MSKATIAGTDTVQAALETKCNANFTELYNMLTGVAASTLLTPTIASFANATHDHADDAGGGATITVEAWNTDIGPNGDWTATVAFKYMKDTMGFVHLSGKYTGKGVAGTLTPLDAALGAGYRPDYAQRFLVNANVHTPYNPGYVNIATDGVITVQYAETGDLVYFDGITFKAA